VPNLHAVAQKKYAVFCRNRTAELHATFLGLVGVPDFDGAEYVPAFTACVPWPGKTNERKAGGMVKKGIMHGVVRYEYKGSLVEEGRKDGAEHGLRVVCVQTGDIWIRLFSNGKRLAQIVLSSLDYSVASNPKPIDEGGLVKLQAHLHLILECFEARPPTSRSR